MIPVPFRCMFMGLVLTTPYLPCALCRYTVVVQIMEELASINALYVEAKNEVESSRQDAAELEELRELKSDIERKEKQQAAIIDQQVGIPSPHVAQQSLEYASHHSAHNAVLLQMLVLLNTLTFPELRWARSRQNGACVHRPVLLYAITLYRPSASRSWRSCTRRSRSPGSATSTRWRT